MKIIRATEEHLDQLVPLFNGYRVFYKQESDNTAAHKFLKERFSMDDSVILMASDPKGNGLGFTQLYPTFSTVSMQRSYILNDLYVSSEARSNGVGAALMDAAKKFAIEQGSKGLTLETAIDNPAQKLYVRLGWKIDDGVNHYTWEV